MMAQKTPVTYMILVPDVLKGAQAPRHCVHHLEILKQDKELNPGARE